MKPIAFPFNIIPLLLPDKFSTSELYGQFIRYEDRSGITTVEMPYIEAWTFLDEVRLIIVNRKRMEALINLRNQKQRVELFNLKDGTAKLIQVYAELSKSNAPHNPDAQKQFDERNRVTAAQIAKHMPDVNGHEM